VIKSHKIHGGSCAHGHKKCGNTHGEIPYFLHEVVSFLKDGLIL
jgi:hypothetical protein